MEDLHHMFLYGNKLSAEIRTLMKEPGARCAVAFWGANSADMLIGPDAKIVCNLQMGGTNPRALRYLKEVEVKQCNNLHAKVYLGKNRAIVASANASTNGLGLEGIEQSKWQEAGVLIENTAEIEAWFISIWDQGSKISDNDWTAAEIAWKKRQEYRPRRPTILDFNTKSDDLPLVTWAGTAKMVLNYDNVRAQTNLYDEKTISDRLNSGIEIEGPEDESILKGKWVLLWNFGHSGLPSKSSRPWWLKMSGVVVKNAIRYEHKNFDQDKVLGAETLTPEPFNANDPILTMAIRDTLMQEVYTPLRESDYSGSWFAPRERLIRPFWTDLRANYLSLSKMTKSSVVSKTAEGEPRQVLSTTQETLE